MLRLIFIALSDNEALPLGRVYYVDHNTRTTTYVRPVAVTIQPNPAILAVNVAGVIVYNVCLLFLQFACV